MPDIHAVASDVRQRVNKLHQKLNSSPIIMFILGGSSLFFWVCGTLVQIQTSEFLALGNAQRVAGVAWGILLQPWFMLSGQLPASQVTSDLYAWVVEIITLVFSLALSVAVSKINAINRHIGRWFVICGLILIALNSWADYSSSPGNNPLVQVLIALAVGMIVTIGLPLGLGLIEHGIEELRA